MKITVSKREKLKFTPEIIDEDATKEARANTPPDDLSTFEPTMRNADFTFHLWPLTLAQEERIMDAVQTAPRDPYGNVKPHASLVNGIFAEQLCGWDGVTSDDEGKVPFPFESAWAKGAIPNEVVQAIDVGHRAAAFAYLMKQAGMGAEAAVGKPE